MTKQTLSVTEMFSSIMELLEQAGYAKHTLWGNMYGSIRSVVSFYHEKGICDYDPAVTLEFLQTVERRYRDGEICREYYNAQKRAARKFEMFHATGTLTWECIKRTSKYQLNEEYSRLLEGFLSSRDFHENTKWDFAWAVRRYLSFFQEKGIPSLDRASINDSREFVIGAAASMAAGSLHNLLCYVRQFHIFLKDSGEKAPDCISLFSYHVPRKMPVRGYVSDEELTAIIGQVDTSTSMGKRDKGIIMLGATTGLRAVDIARLKLTDIDWIRGEIHVMQSKTGGMLYLPLLPEAGESIKDYILNGRPDSDAPEIFLREKAPFVPMASGVGIGYMFDCYCKKAGIDRKPFDGKGFHGLRRRLARNMLVSGTPVTTIAQVLGHQNLDTAKQYLSLDSQNLKTCALDFSCVPLERRFP